MCARLVELSADVAPDSDGITPFKSPLSQGELADWAAVSRDAAVRALKLARELGWLETGRQTFMTNNIEAVRRRVRDARHGVSAEIAADAVQIDRHRERMAHGFEISGMGDLSATT